jgi:hypothetical protein
MLLVTGADRGAHIKLFHIFTMLVAFIMLISYVRSHDLLSEMLVDVVVS